MEATESADSCTSASGTAEGVATEEETAAQLATLTVPERELLEWGKQQEPMMISCFRGPYVVGVDSSLDLFNIQQHIEQCVEPVDDESGTPPETCTHRHRHPVRISTQRASR